MSVFTYLPETAQLTSTPRVQAAPFGDGYEQRTAFGLNTNPESWALTFQFSGPTAYVAPKAFLDAANGVSAFNWTAPGAALSKRYKCPTWSFNVTAGYLWVLTCTFVQDFGN